MEGYGWFGIRNTDLISDGCLGYTENVWMVCNDVRIFDNKDQISHLGINTLFNEGFLECEIENEKLSLFSNGNFNSVYISEYAK